MKNENQVRRAKRVPDLSEMLTAGLAYLNADEAEEMQQALAMAIYAHSLNAKTGGYEAVKVRWLFVASVIHKTLKTL